ncbi:alpha/beta fold hydrolase [Ancylobacter oerskovii]|nr:alpha/beta fold hydrolase [Ancylobacter oerskovii]
MAGCGPPTVPETIAGHAAVAAAFVQALKFTQVDMLGWSLGGVVARQFAHDFPHLVRRLIVAGSSSGALNEGPQQHPRVPQVMTKPENDEHDFLFLFYPETASAVAAGRASLARLAAVPARGPKVSALSFMRQITAISSWPGVQSTVRFPCRHSGQRSPA